MDPAPDPADVEVYEMPDAGASVGTTQGHVSAEEAAVAHEAKVEENDLQGEDADNGNDAIEDGDVDTLEGGQSEADQEGPEEVKGNGADAEDAAGDADAGDADAGDADAGDADADNADADDAEADDAEADDAEADDAEADDAKADDAEADDAGADDADAESAEADDADADDAEADDTEADDADADDADADDADADDADADDADADGADAEDADADGADADAAEADAADDSSSLSDELPTVRLTFQGQDFAAFPAEAQDSGPFVYVEGEEGSDELVRVSAPELRLAPATFWEPLDAFFAALRVKDALGEFLEDGTELCLSFPDLELDLMEDNVYARDITLHDISQLALGFGHQASLHVVVSEEVRFISRYNELAMRMNGAADEVDVSDAQDAGSEAGNGDEGTAEAHDARADDVALQEDMYDMDDDAGDQRPYDDADHAAYEDEADPLHARGKRTADEPGAGEAAKRAKTGPAAS